MNNFILHPEVYILILPGFGIISHVIEFYSTKPIFGRMAMIYSMLAIAALGLVVWGHHMYTSGLEADTKSFFTAATMVIAVPTGVKIFSWLMSLWKGILPKRSIALWYVYGFLFLFTIGGLSGVMLANAALDVILHDTYFVVAHFHFVLSMGAVWSLFAGLYHWSFAVWGFTIGRSIGWQIEHKIWFLLSVVITFWPMHWLGLAGMPRRIPEYLSIYVTGNQLATVGAISSVLSLFFFLIEFAYSNKMMPASHYIKQKRCTKIKKGVYAWTYPIIPTDHFNVLTTYFNTLQLKK